MNLFRARRELHRQRSVRIDLCCNDPENGLPTNRVSALCVATSNDRDMLLELVARSHDLVAARPTGVHLRVTPEAFFLVRKGWRYHRSKAGYGNWCWDAYWTADSEARELLVWLRRSELFELEGGVTELYEAWEAGAEAVQALTRSPALVSLSDLGLPRGNKSLTGREP
jgi:hypothetical protein